MPAAAPPLQHPPPRAAGGRWPCKYGSALALRLECPMRPAPSAPRTFFKYIFGVLPEKARLDTAGVIKVNLYVKLVHGYQSSLTSVPACGAAPRRAARAPGQRAAHGPGAQPRSILSSSADIHLSVLTNSYDCVYIGARSVEMGTH